jgi:hypothetical protein
VETKVDTRTKIVPLAEAQRIAAFGATIVSGYFDPLLASHAERLRNIKREGTPLLVLIADPGNPILPARARAELVAGLAVVDHVVESESGLSGNQRATERRDGVRESGEDAAAPCALTPHIRLEQEHDQRLDELIEHVHARQRAAS